MSEQNRYRMSHEYKDGGWIDRDDVGVWAGDTWLGATQEWIDRYWPSEEYTVVSETPSEDGRSGILEIQFDTPPRFWLGVKIKATLIDD